MIRRYPKSKKINFIHISIDFMLIFIKKKTRKKTPCINDMEISK